MSVPRDLSPLLSQDDGRAILVVGGAVQSVGPVDCLAWGGYWASMVPPFKPERMLVLGLGGATVPRLLVHRWGEGTSIVGVERDPGVLRVARDAGWLDIPGLTVVEGDAFGYLRETPERFDCIGVDLYEGPRFAPRAASAGFLRAAAEHLIGRRWFVLNLYAGGGALTRARFQRITAVFAPRHIVSVGPNVVVHGQPRD